MIFKKLLAITCNHQYFASRQCSDLQIIPTAECSTLLKQYKMHFKQTDISSYTILLQQSNKVKVPAAPLTFYICITGNQFYNYTKYPVASNAADAATSTVDKGNTLLFTGVEAVKDASFVITTTAKPSPLSYQNRNLLGIISITPPKVFCNYTLNLAATATKWRYYIVADKNVKNVEVKEKDAAGSVAGAIKFKDITGAIQTDTTYKSIQISFPDASIFINESDTEIPIMQGAGKIIQCWNVIDKTHEQLLLDNLPLPSYRDNGQKIIHV